MNSLQEDRDLEDEETRYKFHLKREEIEDEKTKREEIEKLKSGGATSGGGVNNEEMEKAMAEQKRLMEEMERER